MVAEKDAGAKVGILKSAETLPVLLFVGAYSGPGTSSDLLPSISHPHEGVLLMLPHRDFRFHTEWEGVSGYPNKSLAFDAVLIWPLLCFLLVGGPAGKEGLQTTPLPQTTQCKSEFKKCNPQRTTRQNTSDFFGVCKRPGVIPGETAGMSY